MVTDVTVLGSPELPKRTLYICFPPSVAGRVTELALP